jgi:hypothetical protein
VGGVVVKVICVGLFGARANVALSEYVYIFVVGDEVAPVPIIFLALAAKVYPVLGVRELLTWYSWVNPVYPVEFNILPL